LPPLSTAFVITIEPACHPAMLEETAGILLQDRIWVNTFDRRCRIGLPLLFTELPRRLVFSETQKP
jgi:hypothetical protein